jgi:predicted acylesterase/phospholipase RssA
MDSINTLVFEGGGVYGVAYIGALLELEKRIDFKKIKYLCGTSIGSLVSFALAMNLKAEDFEELTSKFRLATLKYLPSMVFWLPYNVLFRYGLINSVLIREFVLLVLEKAHPGKKDITFKELDKDLIITATNLTDSYFFVCSKQTTPTMSAVDAVVYSCCGNIVITPTFLKIRKQNKHLLVVDGGASILNYPIAIFSENTNPSYIANMLDNEYSNDLYAQYGGCWSAFERIIRSSNDNKLLGLKFESINPYVNIPISNVISYVWNILNVTYQSLLLVTDKDTRYTITIDMKNISSVDVTYVFIPHRMKHMIEIGAEAVRNFKIH